MRGLIIDSTSEVLLVVAINGDKMAYKLSSGGGKKHNCLLMPFVELLLNEVEVSINDVDAIGAVVGAGSFTGIRLGVSAVNGLAYGANIKLISMNAFEILAYNECGRVLAVIDANHDNFYGGIFENKKEILLGNFILKDLESFDGKVILKKNVSLVENMISVFKEKFDNNLFSDTLIPLYLKKSQAERELECK